MEAENSILAIIAYTLIANTIGIDGVYSELIFIFFAISLLLFIVIDFISEMMNILE
ncbi:hypothetical protein [Natrinema pallidum]|uniref:hypothetical protein n=1 Tax=Natrinema pallidum TaxID=69527 RepID=UPI0013757F14|nr:hypothetical protein [Natrinema pallidum]